METSALLLPAQYSIWIWAPISLLTLACAGWLAWLLREEPDAVVVAPALETVTPRMPRRRAAVRKQRKAQRVARRGEAREQRRPRRPLADTAYGYAYAGA